MSQGSQQIRILLVDDNDMAREMVCALLENVGINVVECCNGLDAIDMVAAAEFDLVLMDVQMPGLDGREATREIRNLDCPYSKTLPIVAMTANSYTEFRVESFAAGMNGHIGKPIDLKVLYTELKRWLPADKQPPLDAFLNPPESDFSALEKLLPRVDVKAGIHRVAGDQKLYLNLLGRFVESFATFEADLLAIIERDEKTEAIRFAHTLKGAAGGLGATELQHLAGKLEILLGQTEKPTSLANVVAELNPLLADMKRVLNEKKETETPTAKTFGADEEVEILLGQLIDPLLNMRVHKVHEQFSQIKSKEWPQKYHSTLNEIETLIEQYQFAPAAGVIDAFLAEEE